MKKAKRMMEERKMRRAQATTASPELLRTHGTVEHPLEFEVQMEGLGKVNHENIVPLRAFYYSKDEKLLVYDFMPAGSLSALLHAMEILEMRNVKVSRFKQWSSLEEMRNV
ncbi:hypothetical protein Scep_004379 [Stephania cephalantha]|uniref:Protein kinase domain-containing protein n=1 Tax=Stephania cephalantha TaxID=152367 RepID=A0AAP0KT99_9MAGN